MATTPFVVEQFGGLSLTHDPLEVGTRGALDLVNVDPAVSPERVKTRAGYTQIADLSAIQAYPKALAAYDRFTTRHLISVVREAGQDKLRAFNGSGTTITSTNITAGTFSAVSYGTPGVIRTLIATHNAAIYSYDGATFTLNAATPAAYYLGLLPTSNRVMAVTGVDTVKLSDAGSPLTAYNESLDLTPGDGETLLQPATWQNNTFVFKQSRFFVFYGESIDSDGGPIFNYRTVDRAGALVNPVAGDEGVYFFDGKSVWVTQGGTPRRISEPIEPWLRGDVTLNGWPVLLNSTDRTVLGYSLGKLYMSVAINDAALAATVVYDPKVDQWSLYSWPAVAFTTMYDGIRECTYWLSGNLASPAAGAINKHDAALTTDNGTAISWFYSSGGYDISSANRVATTLESAVWGTGTVTLKVANDFGSFDTGSALTLGASPAVAQAWQQIDREGAFWQHKLSGSGQATVNRLVHYVSFVKPAGVQ